MLNFRFLSLVGSTRADQSSCLGGRSIHSSRWGFLEASRAASASARPSWRFISISSLVEPGAGGRDGPKSSSESLLSASSSGGVVGRSERGAGGGAGPIIRRGAVSLEWGDKLRCRLDEMSRV